jgi:hypothetical protein
MIQQFFTSQILVKSLSFGIMYDKLFYDYFSIYGTKKIMEYTQKIGYRLYR